MPSVSNRTLRQFLCIGTSQAPLICNGSVIVVSQVPASQLKTGDLAVFKIEQQHVCHRVLEIRGSGPTLEFLMKGDRRKKEDGWIYWNQFIGRVESVDGRTKHHWRFAILDRIMFSYSLVQYKIQKLVLQWRVKSNSY